MTNCDRKSHITNMGATDVMPDSMAKTTSEGLGVLPEMMPKMALERNSPKHDIGIMERLKGEGKDAHRHYAPGHSEADIPE